MNRPLFVRDWYLICAYNAANAYMPGIGITSTTSMVPSGVMK